ncbi:DUF3820 family protein [Breznakibacter xylanolyticus]|nr:DUF3820 family protein [Breznakibacter xylanolyticus]
MEQPTGAFNPQILQELITTRMPYGKYKGSPICDIPEHYLVWYQQKGFPPGKLGVLMGTMYEIRLNGLEFLITKLRQMMR